MMAEIVELAGKTNFLKNCAAKPHWTNNIFEKCKTKPLIWVLNEMICGAGWGRYVFLKLGC